MRKQFARGALICKDIRGYPICVGDKATVQNTRNPSNRVHEGIVVMSIAQGLVVREDSGLYFKPCVKGASNQWKWTLVAQRGTF